jgi:hypothetical protein
MKRRLVITTEIISPYRIPVFNVLAEHPNVDLHVIFLAETDSSMRQWKVYKDEIRFSYEVLPHWRRRVAGYNLLLNRGVASALERARPDVIVCGGYGYLASWQVLGWARRHKRPVLLWSESNQQDQRRGMPHVEMLKRRFIGACSGFVVPGKHSACLATEFLSRRTPSTTHFSQTRHQRREVVQRKCGVSSVCPSATCFTSAASFFPRECLT